MLTASLLVVAALQGMTLKLPSSGELVYLESFRITEASEQGTFSADAERKVRYRVREVSRGRTRFDVSFEDLSFKGANQGLADDLRTWLDVPNRDQWVNERGFVERKDEVRGNRPFMGLILPPPSSSIPDRWTAKLLPPVGSERPADFQYRMDNAGIVGGVLAIAVTASDRIDAITLNVEGRIVLSSDGEIRFGELKTTIVDAESKTTTTIEYRYRKQ